MTTATHKITNIEKVTLNGRVAKVFTLWEKEGDTWIHAGKHSAPARIANKNLADYAANLI